ETDMKHFAIFGRCADCTEKAAAGAAGASQEPVSGS
ncbi:transcriptional repressor, partial [Streptomyces sp. NPDC005406]